VAEVKDLPEKLDVPDAVSEIARRLEEDDCETWAVGGAVRDVLLGESRSDWDLATAARPNTVRKMFRPSYPIGIQFGTVGVRGSDGRVYEVTTFRRDIETDGRHAVVEYADDIDEDLGRRDFTINAIAYHPLRHIIHDPHSGWQDLQNKVIRCVGDPRQRFAEDYLRVLRGLRFAGRFRFQIEQNTWDALTEAVPLLPRLSGERIREELLKILDAADPSRSLALYRESGALAVVFPELAGVEEDGWAQLLRTVDAISAARRNLRLTALFLPAGAQIESMMRRLRFSSAEIRHVTALSRALGVPLPAPGDVVAARRWLRDVLRDVPRDEQSDRARDVLRRHFGRARGREAGPADRVRLAAQGRTVLNMLRRDDPVTVSRLVIDGNDLKELGLRPGPEFRRILDDCLDAVIEDPALNERDTLLELVRRGM
jgi:tRNA nucleotidyltransferase/poly(A) polymerase